MLLKLSRRLRRLNIISKRKRFLILLALPLTIYFWNVYNISSITHKSLQNKLRLRPLSLPNVVVHIDLKASPPKLEYLKNLLPMLKTHGVNGLLMEYEDMFPYENVLVNFSAKNGYEKYELQEFLRLAVQNGFEIIPLIPTLGQMEFALKLPEFQHLREEPSDPGSLCPSKKQSLELIEDMLEQVIIFHEDIAPLKHIHIGCGEVEFINECKHCTNRLMSEIDIFINHIKRVAATIKNISPWTTVLVWDNVFRKIESIKWNEIGSLGDIKPVYRDFKPSLTLQHTVLHEYQIKFGGIWIASGYKGSDGDGSVLPDLQNRFLNHFSWMTWIYNYKGTEVYEGIILSGLSRQNYLGPPLELLPVSIPSLIINLLTIDRFKRGSNDEDGVDNWVAFYDKHVKKKVMDELKCETEFDLEEFESSKCNFDGAELSKTLVQCLSINRNILDVLDNYKFGFSAKIYYNELGELNEVKISDKIMWCKFALEDIKNIETKIQNVMSRSYHNDSIKEYIDVKTYKTKRTIQSFLVDLGDFLNMNLAKRMANPNLKAKASP